MKKIIVTCLFLATSNLALAEDCFDVEQAIAGKTDAEATEILGKMNLAVSEFFTVVKGESEVPSSITIEEASDLAGFLLTQKFQAVDVDNERDFFLEAFAGVAIVSVFGVGGHFLQKSGVQTAFRSKIAEGVIKSGHGRLLKYSPLSGKQKALWKVVELGGVAMMFTAIPLGIKVGTPYCDIPAAFQN